MTTSDVLENLAASRARLLASFAGLDDEQLARRGSVGAWSIKDTLGHVAAWERIVVGFLPEWLATGTAPEVLMVMEEHGEDAANAVEVAERAALTPREQFEELEQARARLVAYIQALGDAALERTRPFPDWEDTLAAYFVELVGAHEVEHTEAIAATAERLRGGGGSG
jgi:uncharacterized damage-inducible protein DinB